MIALVVLGILAAVLVPGMREFVVAQRVRALANDLATDLMLARSEALKRNATAQLVAATGGHQSGWVVSAGALVLGWRGATGSGIVVDGAVTSITFNASGRMTAPNTQLRMTVRPQGSSPYAAARCVELDLSGRVRTQAGTCT